MVISIFAGPNPLLEKFINKLYNRTSTYNGWEKKYL